MAVTEPGEIVSFFNQDMYFALYNTTITHPGGVTSMVVILLTNSEYLFFQISQLKKLGMEVCGHAFGRDFFASFGTNSGRSFAESNALQHKLLMFMDCEFSC